MIVINMLDGEKIFVKEDTLLIGINNISSKESFYLQQNYIGNLQGDFEKEGSLLSTSDERLGIGGFILSHDMFALSDSLDATFYLTSAVKSISVVD